MRNGGHSLGFRRDEENCKLCFWQKETLEHFLWTCLSLHQNQLQCILLEYAPPEVWVRPYPQWTKYWLSADRTTVQRECFGDYVRRLMQLRSATIRVLPPHIDTVHPELEGMRRVLQWSGVIGLDFLPVTDRAKLTAVYEQGASPSNENSTALLEDAN